MHLQFAVASIKILCRKHAAGSGKSGRIDLKIIKFLRSMTFGVILLALIVACSLVGSVVLQGKEAAYYEAQYGSSVANTIRALGFDHIFSTPYFIALLALLGLNLILCSLTRLRLTTKAAREGIERAAKVPAKTELSGKKSDKLEAFLQKQRFKAEKRDGVTVYFKNKLGHYGSFVTHLSILLVMIFAGAALYSAVSDEYTILPGESTTLSDGTKIQVNDFRLTDEDGKIDYVSTLTVTAKNGAEKTGEISVNYPMSFGGHKYYQSTYGVKGSLTIKNPETGGTDEITLDEPTMLTVSENAGIMYVGCYPAYETDEEGKVSLLNSGTYENPIYQIAIQSGENDVKEGVVTPGETLECGGIYFTFNAPVMAAGVLVKTVSTILMGMLYLSFGLMIVGLWLCFFHAPVYVTVHHGGYAISGPKSNVGLQTQIDLELEESEG